MDEASLNEIFFQARLKINRANRHTDEVRQWFESYTETDFYDIIDDRNAETGEQLVRVTVKPVPADMVLAIGDAFHCLSAALDYVMSGLMRAKTGNAIRVHFPTDESRKRLRKSFMAPKPGKKTPANRRIVKAFPLIVFELLTIIKPYQGGDFRLREIRRADNIDKHNLIIPSVTVTEIRDLRMVDKVHDNTVTTTVSLGAGGVINLIGYRQADGSHLEFESKGQATASISFPESLEVFGGEPVLPTLLECSHLVAEVVKKIEVLARRYL